MLPAAHRLRRSDQFRTVLRGRDGSQRLPGGRAGGDLMTVHAVRRATTSQEHPVPRVGFVVSSAVGNSVVRHRTQRRLRHLMAARVPELAAGTDLVVRAHPAAAGASSSELSAELDRLLTRTLGRLGAGVAS